MRIGFLSILLFCLFPRLAIGQDLSIFKDVDIDVLRFRYNTATSEFSPAVIGDTLFYVAYAIDDKESGTSEPANNKYFYIVKVFLDKNGALKSKPVFDYEKSSKYHDGSLCYDSATACYFITRSGFDGARKENIVFRKKIVELKIDCYDPAAKTSEPFAFNSSAYSLAHPAISPRGDTLFFSSDMPGGYGGKDIYRSVCRNGIWRKPENLGPVINSKYDEMFPSVHTDGTFFFASDRPDGYGGLDLYACVPKKNGGFSRPALLPEPVNSASDDFGLSISGSGLFGFFSSNRAGKGDDDLFQLFFDKQTKAISGRVTDSISGVAIPGVSVELYDKDGNCVKKQKSALDGSFEVEFKGHDLYQLKVEKENYRTATRELDYDSKNADIQLVGSYQLELTVLSADTKLPVDEFTVRNSNNGRTWDGKNGTSTFKLLHNEDYSLLIESEGFLYQRIDVNTSGASYGVINHTVLLYPFKVDKVFELENIYYNFNKWELTESSERELDKLVSVLKENPDVQVHLRSHTDSRGSDLYNLDLSQKRSRSCEKYLIQSGILPDRIHPHGYGESQLLNKCDDNVPCPDELHQVNRRTEIKFDKYVPVVQKQEKSLKAINPNNNRFFIIGGVFQNRDLAFNYLKKLKQMGFADAANLGENEKGSVFIALDGFPDLNQAKTRLNKIKEKEGLADVWLLDAEKYQLTPGSGM